MARGIHRKAGNQTTMFAENESVILTVTEDEAQFLREIMGACTGHGRYVLTAEVFEALERDLQMHGAWGDAGSWDNRDHGGILHFVEPDPEDASESEDEDEEEESDSDSEDDSEDEGDGEEEESEDGEPDSEDDGENSEDEGDGDDESEGEESEGEGGSENSDADTDDDAEVQDGADSHPEQDYDAEHNGDEHAEHEVPDLPEFKGDPKGAAVFDGDAATIFYDATRKV